MAHVSDVETARERLRNFLIDEVRAERKSAVLGRGIDVRWHVLESLMEDLRVAAVQRDRTTSSGHVVSLPDEVVEGAINERLRAAAVRREKLHNELRFGPMECAHDCTCTCSYPETRYDGEKR